MDRQKGGSGCIEGDWEGEFTYVGARESSVIDYVLVNENIRSSRMKFVEKKAKLVDNLQI